MTDLTFTYQTKSLQLEGWSKPDTIQEMLLELAGGGSSQPTGLGYARVTDNDGLPLFYAVHLPSKQAISTTPFATERVVKRYLKALLPYESIEEYLNGGFVDWYRSEKELLAHYGRAKLTQITRDARAEAEDFIGWANAENTLSHLFAEHDHYLKINLKPEYYARLLETLDLIANERMCDDGNL